MPEVARCVVLFALLGSQRWFLLGSPEIAKMGSLRFTFAVCFTQQSYYRQQKTYQAVSVATLHVNQPAAPVAIEGPEGADREAQKEDQQKETTETVAAVSGDKIDGLSPPAKHVHGTSLSNT